MPIIVTPYDPSWAQQFIQIAASLSSLLAHTPYISIEHVGSTSVPGLPAKPILDIDIVVTPAQLQPVIDALRLTYVYMGELGIPNRHVFRAPELLPVRNLYACIEGSVALRNHIAVRDLLRRDKGIREEYGKFKLELGSRDLEIHEYMALKSEMVMRILRLSGGLSEEEMAAISKATSSPKTLKPIKTKRLKLRELIITDANDMCEANLSATPQEAKELAVEIIQDMGKAEREHVELAVLSQEDEGVEQLVGRIGVRVLSPGIKTADSNLMTVFRVSLRRAEPALLLYSFFNPELSDRGYVEEAMGAFVPVLDPFIPTITKALGKEVKPEPESLNRTTGGGRHNSLGAWERRRIDEGVMSGRVVYEVERSDS